MEARREIAKRARTAATSQGSAGGGAAASSGVAVSMAATEMDGEEMGIVAAAEPGLLGSSETEEHVQRILLANNFTRKASEMLVSGRAMFKDLAADFEDRLCTIHRERVEKWEEEIRELRARDAVNEKTRALLHNAQLQLFHIRD